MHPLRGTIAPSGDLAHPCDLIGLRAFLALHDVKLDLVAFLQALVAIDLNGAVMHEHVRSVIAANKAVTLRVVEPLHFAFELSHKPWTFLQADFGWRGIQPACD
jgi:hypothetical protein